MVYVNDNNHIWHIIGNRVYATSVVPGYYIVFNIHNQLKCFFHDNAGVTQGMNGS